MTKHSTTSQRHCCGEGCAGFPKTTFRFDDPLERLRHRRYSLSPHGLRCSAHSSFITHSISRNTKQGPGPWVHTQPHQVDIPQFSSIPSLSQVQLFAAPWTAACPASLSNTNSLSLLKLMSIELMMPSNHLILCHPLSSYPQSFPASGSFSMSQLFTSGGQSFGVSVLASVLLMNIQD